MSTPTVCFAGCPCVKCQQRRTVHNRRAKLRAMGRPTFVDPAPAAEHIDKLLAAGMRAQDIARVAGLSPATIRELRVRERKLVNRRTLEAVLRAQFEQGITVPSIGLVRRARALVAIGWTFQEIEQRAGLTRFYIRLTAGRMVEAEREGKQSRVRTECHVAVDQVFRELCMTPGPLQRQRVFARNKGWAPPLAWDDIDDPNETPSGVGYQPANRLDILKDLVAQKASMTDACRRLKVGRSALQKWCGNHGCSDLYRQLAAPEVLPGTVNQYHEADKAS